VRARSPFVHDDEESLARGVDRDELKATGYPIRRALIFAVKRPGLGNLRGSAREVDVVNFSTKGNEDPTASDSAGGCKDGIFDGVEELLAANEGSLSTFVGEFDHRRSAVPAERCKSVLVDRVDPGAPTHSDFFDEASLVEVEDGNRRRGKLIEDADESRSDLAGVGDRGISRRRVRGKQDLVFVGEALHVVDREEVDSRTAVSACVADIDRIDLATFGRDHRRLRRQEQGRIDHPQDFSRIAVVEKAVAQQSIRDPDPVITRRWQACDGRSLTRIESPGRRSLFCQRGRLCQRGVRDERGGEGDEDNQGDEGLIQHARCGSRCSRLHGCTSVVSRCTGNNDLCTASILEGVVT
jgi:hypothetical protein